MDLDVINQISLYEASGLQEKATTYLTQINQNIATLSNQNASVDARVQAYNDFAQIQEQFSSLSAAAGIYYQTALTKLNAFMSEAVVSVLSPSTDGSSEIPLQLNKKNVTLLDIVNAIDQNSGETLTAHVHFDEADKSLSSNDVSWCNHQALWNDLDEIGFDCLAPGSQSCGYTENSGISWECTRTKWGSKDVDMDASGSVQEWEGYDAVCDFSSSQCQAAYNDLANFLQQ